MPAAFHQFSSSSLRRSRVQPGLPALALFFALLGLGCGAEKTLLDDFTCNDLAHRCPPLTACMVDAPAECSDCGGYCHATTDEACAEDSDCSLSGYGCVEGNCRPTDLCSETAECSDGRFCYFGSAFRHSTGICVEIENTCTKPSGCECSICGWGEWLCADLEGNEDRCGEPPPPGQ